MQGSSVSQSFEWLGGCVPAFCMPPLSHLPAVTTRNASQKLQNRLTLTCHRSLSFYMLHHRAFFQNIKTTVSVVQFFPFLTAFGPKMPALSISQKLAVLTTTVTTGHMQKRAKHCDINAAVDGTAMVEHCAHFRATHQLNSPVLLLQFAL